MLSTVINVGKGNLRVIAFGEGVMMKNAWQLSTSLP